MVGFFLQGFKRFALWLATAWTADAIIVKIGFVVAALLAVWQYIAGAGPLALFVMSLLALLVALGVAELVRVTRSRDEQTSTQRDMTYSSLIQATHIIVLVVLGLFLVLPELIEKRTPSTEDKVTEWIRQLSLQAEPADPRDYDRLVFQYKLFLPQGQAQLYARSDEPEGIVTVEGDVEISKECYDHFTVPHSLSLNRVQSAMLPSGVRVLPGVWHDRRRLIFRSVLFVDPSHAAQDFYSRLQSISWAHRVAREMGKIICEGVN